MTKNKGIISLLIVFVLIVLGAYTALFGFGEDRKGSAYNIKQGLDLAGGVSITYQVVGDGEPSAEDMSDTIYKLQQRVTGYSTESLVYQEGTNRINIEIPGVSDANAILEELGKPGSLSFIAETAADGSANYHMTMTAEGGIEYVLDRTIDEIYENGSVVLEGTDVKDARAEHFTDNMQNTTVGVDLTMTTEGAAKFAEATNAAFQKRESIGIYYDGEIISAPSVNDVISDGKAQITGGFDYEYAQQLASTIRIGGLKLELEELRSNVVGAQLGETAIETSLMAATIGLGLIAVFMIAVYLIPGLASVIALLAYVVIIVLVLNGFELTLTLPGIAGIILSIGMAVDANVIIFARIREEIATGKTVSSSINIGFKKALSAILDGNITTLIAAAVLGVMGTGAVKGFAQTLALGIVVSMFTALVVTRVLMNAFYALGIRNEKFYGTVKERKQFDFLSRKGIFFGISLVVIVAGFVFMGVNKAGTGEILNYSLEFKGGTSTNVTFNEDMTLETIDSQVVPVVSDAIGGGAIQTQKVKGTNEVIIKTKTLELDQREALNAALAESFGVDTEKIIAETISSTVSAEMKSDAIVAVIVATICMLIYIWLRFKDARFGASSVLALVHDVLVVLAFYAVAKVSVGSTFIACMLTIVGYSINATIVVFDRVRENISLANRKETLQDIVNKSINQTLSRSIFTSLTTFVMVAALYVLGVTSIREFALPIMVGIICGAYSSVCLAGAMWYVFKTKLVGKKAKKTAN